MSETEKYVQCKNVDNSCFYFIGWGKSATFQVYSSCLSPELGLCTTEQLRVCCTVRDPYPEVGDPRV